MTEKTQSDPGFAIAPRKTGFHVTFENGHTVSVQFGNSNYCANRDLDAFLSHNGKEDGAASANAEIAGIAKDGSWIRYPGWDDDVEGWQTPAQVLEFMNYVAGLE